MPKPSARKRGAAATSTKKRRAGKDFMPEFAANPFNKTTKARRASSTLRQRRGTGGTNAFLDRRLGENVEAMTHEEKLFARFQRQQARQASRTAAGAKKRKFNLEDDDNVYGTDTLTHKGRPLEEEGAIDDGFDDDSDDGGMFGKDFVSRAHFGGGDGPAGPRTHKEIMEEVIAKSKAYKEQRRVEKEEQEEVLDALDDNLDLIQSLMDSQPKPNTREERRKAAAEARSGVADTEYDRLLSQLKTDAQTARAAERKKSPEELANAHAARLKVLQAAQARRMQSGGAASGPGGDELGRDVAPAKQGVRFGELIEDEEDASGGFLPVEPSSAKKKSLSKRKMGAAARLAAREAAGTAAVEDPDFDGDEGSSSEEDSSEEGAEEADEDGDSDSSSAEESSSAGEEVAEAGAGASHQPRVPVGDDTEREYEALLASVGAWHPDGPTSMQDLEEQFSALFDVTQDRSGRATAVWRRFLVRLRAATTGVVPRWPTGGELMQIKLCLSLFPVTDFRHQVLSPLKLLMSQWLVQCPMTSVVDAATGLGVVALFGDATQEAKRVVPEVIAFLHGVCALVAKSAPSALAHVALPTFRAVPAFHTQFRAGCASWCPPDAAVPRLAFDSFHTAATRSATVPPAATPAQCASVLGTTYRLLRSLLPTLSECDAAPELLQPLLGALGAVHPKAFHISLKVLHMETRVAVRDLVARVTDRRHHLELQAVALRLQPIKMHTPSFEMGFDPEKAETAKDAIRRLQRRVKREAKGAARDIHKEAVVVAREDREARLEREAEREAKYKEVVQFLQGQAATGNEVARLKALSKR